MSSAILVLEAKAERDPLCCGAGVHDAAVVELTSSVEAGRIESERAVNMAMRVDDILKVLSEHGPDIKARFGVGWLALFGSAARGEAGPDSDLDILVEFRMPTFRNYMGLHRYLEGLLDRPVDLVSVAALRPPMKQEVLREARRVA